MSLVAPAILAKSERDFDSALATLSALPVSRIQIDVVDGEYARPASWPYVAPKELRDRAESGDMLPHLNSIEYEIDLMCFDPLEAAELWLMLGASRLTLHAGSSTNIPDLVASARTRYGQVVSLGLALPVGSGAELIDPVRDQIEYVQCMGIARIGRQGEPFDPRTYEQVSALYERYPDLPIQVDGGVSLTVAKTLLTLGVSRLIVGSGLALSGDPSAALASYEALAKTTQEAKWG